VPQELSKGHPIVERSALSTLLSLSPSPTLA